MVRAAVLLILLVAACGLTNGQRMRKFIDTAHGVSFRYPSNWKLDKFQGAYVPSLILQNPRPGEPDRYRPTAAVELMGNGDEQSPYANTNFVEAAFVFRIAPELNEQACYDVARPASQIADTKPDWQTIGGVRFLHGRASEFGMCHDSEQDVYARFRSGRCYLFDAQLNTACKDVTPRNISDSQLKAIARTLHDISESIRFGR
jgi:hypothetical protein